MRYSQWAFILFLALFSLGRLEVTVLVKRITGLREELATLKCHLRASEQRVRWQDRRLEEKITIRTAELIRDKQRAEAANRAKSDFLANMSHELRAPLTTILGFSSLLAYDSNLTPQQYENLQTIAHSGEHLLALINGVLDLSKIEAGSIAVQPKAFDLHEMLLELERMFQFHAGQKGLNLRFERLSDVPQYICADQDKLHQILINLLSNAVKFTSTGRVVVRVRTENPPQTRGEYKPNDQCVLSFVVEDTGVGIAPDELDKVFEAFMQTESGRKAKQGTGLGLSISRTLVRLMGGELTVHSEVNVGSRFQFAVPVTLSASREKEALQAVLAQPRIIGLEDGQPVFRLLLVEDVKANRELLVKLLQPLGFKIREAANAQEAVEIVAKWHPHLVFLDMPLPVLDGHVVAQRIKTIRADTVIVALTSAVYEEGCQKLLQLECDECLYKPFKVDDILAALRKYLGVRFLYEHEVRGGMEARAETVALGPDAIGSALATLPIDLLQNLELAALRSDPQQILDIVGHIHIYDPRVAEALKRLVNTFDYARILALIQTPVITDVAGYVDSPLVS
jgi:signal transduction histidine kinase/DNA-binding NarL/FixJ family response regulator